MAFYNRAINHHVAFKSLTAATTLTASDSGKIFGLAAAAGFTVTLPTAAQGLHFRFVATVNPTSGAYIILSATADTMIGWPSNIGGADSVADGNAAGDQVNFASGVALAGDQVEIFSDGTSWFVTGHAKAINAITITG